MEEWAADADAWLTALADGEPVDWGAAEQGARSPQQRQFVRQLRLVARIAETYRDASASASGSNTSLGGLIEVVEPVPGTRWGAFEIVGVLGRGTFGDVYRARDTRLDRIVALKLLRTERRARGTVPSEVVNEGRLLARVRHPNVAAVFGADRIDGRVGVWMELIEGRTLEDELRERGPLPPDEVVRIGLDLCRALAAVHDAGLLHRDVKTQNVMRDACDGRIVLMDLSAGRELTESGTAEQSLPLSLAGSPAYLAPEVLSGQPASPRSDVYSLGVLLFRLLTRAFPVSGTTLRDIGDAHAAGARTRLSDVASDLPAPLLRIVESATHPSLAERPQTAHDMEQALIALVEPRRDQSETPRRRWAIAVAVALLIGAAGLVMTRAGRGGDASLSLSAAPSVLLLVTVDDQTDPAPARALEAALRAELSSGAGVSLVPRDRLTTLLARMRQRSQTPIDVRLARELVMRDGDIRAIVVGSVRREGDARIITAGIINPSDGAMLSSENERLSLNSSAVPAVRALAARLNAKAGAIVPSLPRPTRQFEPVTTASLKALELYSRAASLLSGEVTQPTQRDFEHAQGLLRQAVEEDPAFASAWMLLGRAIRAADPHTHLNWPALEQADRLAEGVGHTEQLLIRAYVRSMRGYDSGDTRELEAAAKMYESWLAREGMPTERVAPPGTESPRHAVVPELERVYQSLGRRDAAERLILEAGKSLPHSMRLTARIARIEMRKGNLGAARALAMRVQAASQSDGPNRNIADIAWARLWEAHAAFLAGDARKALSAIEQAERQWNDQGQQRAQWGWHLSRAFEGLGRFDDSERVARRLGGQFVDGGLTFPEHTRLIRDLGVLELSRGRLVAAREWFGQLQSFEEFCHVALALVRAGMLDKAEWVATERRRLQRMPVWEYRAVDEGSLRVAQGRFRDGLRLLEPVVATTSSSLFAREYSAIAYQGLGNLEEAIRLLEPSERQRADSVSAAWTVQHWLRCRVLLVELYREAGRLEDAAQVEAEVRTLLAVADAGNPLLARLDRP